VKMVTHDEEGSLWAHAVNYISNFMSMTSPETIGQNANEELVKQRAPMSGFIPGLRLCESDNTFAKQLFTDAYVEREVCDQEELLARISWMKQFVDDVMKQL